MIEAAGIRLDAGLIPGLSEWLEAHAAQAPAWFDEMVRLEAGAVANPDEGRMVGHYWLRAPERAPRPELRQAIEQTVAAVRAFAADVHAGAVAPPAAPLFKNVLVIGIGGSALGPQLVADALGSGRDRMRLFFCDNTDPDGMDRLFESLAAAEGGLAATLAVVISKSGGTKETRNGMLESAHAWRRAGLEFPAHAVAVTGAGSELDRLARSEGWRAIFPMWDWVGGRTSVTSAVGLLPAALQGIDVEAFLDGARDMDEATRATDLHTNMAAVLAAAWHAEGAGRGERDMVILPYRDRLVLLSRYLQQLVMESLGKELDRAGRAVHQGIAVYGNKGSTDQHAYVQQLRDGRHNFFVNFVHVLRDREGDALLVEPDVTSGDYLFGFLMGTRRALAEKGRGSLLLSLDELTPRTLGALIALYERAVGLYAAMIDVNAYHQPGVEAGKKAAGDVLDLQRRVLAALRADRAARTADELAAASGGADRETVWWILEHLAANPGRGVRREAGGRYRLA